jgi:hypothetical protein
MTFNDLGGHTLFLKHLCLNNIRNHRNFYQNLFINEYATKKQIKSSSPRVLVRFRRTYVLNDKT